MSRKKQACTITGALSAQTFTLRISVQKRILWDVVWRCGR